jgi:hypothetical protein
MPRHVDIIEARLYDFAGERVCLRFTVSGATIRNAVLVPCGGH